MSPWDVAQTKLLHTLIVLAAIGGLVWLVT